MTHELTTRKLHSAVVEALRIVEPEGLSTRSAAAWRLLKTAVREYEEATGLRSEAETQATSAETQATSGQSITFGANTR